MIKALCTTSILIALLGSLLTGCTNSKQLAYFQDLSDTAKTQSVDVYSYQPLRLQPDDQVQVFVSSISPEGSQFFNTVSANDIRGQGVPNLYTVAQDGTITLPILGDIKAAGLTTEALKISILASLKDYLKEPVVSVRLTNFKVTVIGEVTRPIVVPVDGEKINVLQALGAAGDLTVYGTRGTVKVMRYVGDKMKIGTINLNTTKTMESDFFQLRQNDVVYVTPVKNKGISSEKVTIFLPIAISLITAISLLIVNINNF